MSHFRALLAELKRRGVWRIAVLYTGAAFVAVEAADLFLPNLGLPEWTVRVAAMLAVAGFPVAIVLAWAFDLTSEGIRPAEAEAGTERASGRNRRLAVAVLAAVTVLLGGAGWWVYDGGRGGPEIRRLAVLPLTNLMDDPGQEYFVRGMHDRLISELQQAGVAVIARTSVMAYVAGDTPVRQIATELGIDAVIEASVFRAGDSVAIEARLVDGVTEEYIWRQSFSRHLGRVEALYRDLTRAIASEIRMLLTPGAEPHPPVARPIHPRAYEAYLRGVFHLQRFTEEDRNTALGYFERSLEIDSTYAPAWVGVARTRAGHGKWVRGQWHPALRRALALDPDLAEAHFLVATTSAWNDWDWKAAERAFRRAIELNPAHAESRVFYGHLLTILGRWEEAAEQMQLGLELDPLNPFIQGMHATQLVMTRHSDEAIERLRGMLRRNPGAGFGRGVLAATLRDTGRQEEGLMTFREEYESIGEDQVVAALDRGYAEGGYPRAYGLAAETLAAMERPGHGPVVIAGHFRYAGETAHVLDWLERALAERDINMPYIGAMPTFEPLHDHPRFREMARRVNVPILSPLEQSPRDPRT